MKQRSHDANYFSNKRFSGDIKQSIAVIFRDYRHCEAMCDVDDAAMSTNFASALNDPARAFILSNVHTGMSFNAIQTLIMAELNRNSRQI